MTSRYRTFEVLLGTLIFALTPATAPWCAGVATGRVVQISSGDTVTLRIRGQRFHARISGIDAPELDQPYGSAARKALARLVFNRRVEARQIAGSDAVELVAVEWGGRDVAEALVSMGHAWARPSSGNRRLLALQRQARHARRGMWAYDGNVPPWDWRRGARADSTGRKGLP